MYAGDSARPCILAPGMKMNLPDGKTLPLIVEPDDDVAGASESSAEAFALSCVEEGDWLREKLLECGALLLRGLPAATIESFARFVRLFGGREPLDYVGGASPRVKLGGGVYTSTEYPEHYSLTLHNELSYTYRWPAHLFFCCVTAPTAGGGETPIADSRALLRRLDPAVVSLFKSKKIEYERNLSGDASSRYSWQAAFETTDGAAVEEYCREGGVSFRWGDDGGLRLREVRPATVAHPATGEEVWFNQADGFHPSALDAETYRSIVSTAGEEGLRLNARFGDGSAIERAALDHVREAARAEMVLVPWRAGDVLVLDNLLTAHGRMPFTGPRKILLAMT